MKATTNIVGLILVIALLVLFTGCGGRKETQKHTETSPGKESALSLPKGYPIDLVPIMEDATSASGIETSGVFNVSYSTPSSREEVMTFYSDHFSKYQDAVKIGDGNRELNLEVAGQSINIQLDASGEKTSVRISIVGQDTENTSSETEETSSSASGKFPTNVVPLMGGASIIDEINEQEEHSVTYQINKPFGETTNFYRKAVKKMSSPNISEGQGEFFATAKKGKSSIEIQITESTTTDSIVQINIYN